MGESTNGLIEPVVGASTLFAHEQGGSTLRIRLDPTIGVGLRKEPTVVWVQSVHITDGLPSILGCRIDSDHGALIGADACHDPVLGRLPPLCCEAAHGSGEVWHFLHNLPPLNKGALTTALRRLQVDLLTDADSTGVLLNAPAIEAHCSIDTDHWKVDDALVKRLAVTNEGSIVDALPQDKVRVGEVGEPSMHHSAVRLRRQNT
mmetsp:Transcript_39612/g.89022  ORF Transcript_39612/g.89022 Transcript_39612/m.89022 type:complete len:204 (-) Transcript_39612:465-1076(-)